MYIILNSDGLKDFPPRPGTKQECLLSPLLSDTALHVLARATVQEKDIKCVQTGKEELKLSMFQDNMIVYVGNKDSILKNRVRIYQFSKITGYKVNM